MDIKTRIEKPTSIKGKKKKKYTDKVLHYLTRESVINDFNQTNFSRVWV